MSHADSDSEEIAQPIHLLSRYTHVLLILIQDPNITIRELSIVLDVTERTALRTLNELEKKGFISIERRGRNNWYRVLLDAQSLSRFENNRTVRDLIGLVIGHEHIKEEPVEGI
jgi:DNA-binding transcriptional ArsR family regulator